MDSGTAMIPWSDLPKELVERIGSCFVTYIDVLRFRSVCTTWRSSLSPFKTIPPLPLKLTLTYEQPSGYDPEYCSSRNLDFYLIQSTVYLFQSTDGTRRWLVKVTQTVDGKLRILNPVTDKPITILKYQSYREGIGVLPDSMPRVLNLLDFRVSQVSKAYHVQHVDHPSTPSIEHNDIGHLYSKILLSANHVSLLGIDHAGLLLYLNLGDENWTVLKDSSCNIVDIILYKGDFYAVDLYGKTVKFDSSFNEITIVSSILYDIGGMKKRLVESLGQLFLVDIVLGIVDNTKPCWNPFLLKAMEINIYRLDEEKHEWVAVTSLGDRIFFAGDDCCFSVSSQVFGEGCRGNCIYFANRGTMVGKYWDYGDNFHSLPRGYFPDHFGAVVGKGEVVCDSIPAENQRITGGLSKELVRRYEGLHHNTGVFTIEDGKIRSLLSCLEYADIFWPPPSWLNQARSDALDAVNSASSMTKTLSKELADVKKKLRDLACSASSFNSPNLVLLEAPQDPTKELSRLLGEGKYEEAFSAALQSRGVSNIVPWLCSQVDLAGILSMNPLPLSEGVLVSLLQQLACDVSKETSPKLSWMRDLLSAINSSSFLARNSD